MLRRAILLFCLGVYAISPGLVWAGPTSSNYELQDYSFGSGSGEGASPNYGSFSDTGSTEFGQSSSANYTYGGGLEFQLQTDTPATPTITNPSTFYDRLKFTLDPGSSPSDIEYAIAISPDAFATTTNYITPSLTLGTSLSGSNFQTYATWGGASGAVVTGLDANKTYTIKVKARQGTFTESEYSPTASAATVLPSLTFTVSGAVDMGTWSEANNYSSTANSTLTTSTNAYSGYSVYGFETTTLNRTNGGGTIANYSGTYASPASWTSGEGFGYTTNDTSIANSDKWDANPCPGDSGSPLCYAAFSQAGPGDVVVDHETNLAAGPIVDEEFTVTYKVVTNGTQPAGRYSTTIVYTVAPIY